jgi:hypothetical protein
MFGFGRKKRPVALSTAKRELAAMGEELRGHAIAACFFEEALHDEYEAECGHAQKRLYDAIVAEDEEAVSQYLDEIQEAKSRLLAHAPILHAAKSMARVSASV